ncbi:MAG: hypothetical protein HY399_06980 [Elusimicrobia bacterium]|nr:hypothetical protein [Elusimicrobiota bacterium]
MNRSAKNEARSAKWEREILFCSSNFELLSSRRERSSWISGGSFMHALRARILGILLLSLVAPAFSWAAPTFNLEPGTQISTATPQQVLSAGGGVFRMYFIRDNFQVLSATSSDKVNWTQESGVRLSTSPAPAIDASSITACSVFTSTAGWRMVYSAISSSGVYSVLSATSADGLTWFKEAGFRLHLNGGQTYLASPRVLRVSNNLLRMYYVEDSSNTNTPATYFIRSASSTNEGQNWTIEGTILSTPTAEVSVSTLTDGRYRMFYSQLQSGTTISQQILSAISNNGLNFQFESGRVLSTSTSLGRIGFPVVDRSTETFRWRLYYAFTATGSSIPATLSALTLNPAGTGFSPSTTLNTTSTTSFTFTGEVFGATPTVRMVQGATSITATGVTTQSDLAVTGNFNTVDAPTGNWDVVLTNPDGNSVTLSGALFVDIPSGTLDLLDNLIRPRLAQSTTITVTIYEAGRVTLKLYTFNGELVKTILDEDEPKGTFNASWNGTTGSGNTVASGVYLLHANGPKLSETKKIVVIK